VIVSRSFSRISTLRPDTAAQSTFAGAGGAVQRTPAPRGRRDSHCR
jgi:hypothetical protein